MSGRYVNRDSDLLKEGAYLTVWGFMRKELRLEKTELLVYALIYGYFRNGETFTGTQRYISEWTGSGHSAVAKAINSLIEKGYIRKTRKKWGTVCIIEYSINVDALPRIPMHREMLDVSAIERRREQRVSCDVR